MVCMDSSSEADHQYRYEPIHIIDMPKERKTRDVEKIHRLVRMVDAAECECRTEEMEGR